MPKKNFINDDELENVNGGVVAGVVGLAADAGGLAAQTIPVAGLNEFIRTCKNAWGLDLNGALANLASNWAAYKAQWGKGNVAPNYDACVTYVKAHWDKVA